MPPICVSTKEPSKLNFARSTHGYCPTLLENHSSCSVIKYHPFIGAWLFEVSACINNITWFSPLTKPTKPKHHETSSQLHGNASKLSPETFRNGACMKAGACRVGWRSQTGWVFHGFNWTFASITGWCFENGGSLEKEIPFWKPAFSGFMLSFRGCICIYTYIHAFAEEIKDDKGMIQLTKIFLKLAETSM